MDHVLIIDEDDCYRISYDLSRIMQKLSKSMADNIFDNLHRQSFASRILPINQVPSGTNEIYEAFGKVYK